MPADQIIDALSHSRQASQLRDQLRGLLPDSAESAVATVNKEAGDGAQRLLDYVRLVMEYQQPIGALLNRILGRVPTPAMPEISRPAQRFGWRSVLVVGVVAGLGVIAYEMTKTSRNSARNA